MNRILRLIMVGALALVFLPGVGSAWAAGYLKIGDIKGESVEPKHKDWINLLSVSGPTMRATDSSAQASRQASGKRQHKPFVITKELDKASPKLQEAATTGKVFDTVIIETTESDYGGSRATYLRYELKNCRVTSYSVSGAGAAGDVPTETFSLNYEEVKFTTQAAEDNRKDKKKKWDRDR